MGANRPWSDSVVSTKARLGRKLDMPIFQGENPEGWVFREKRYFQLNQLTEEEKLMAAIVSFYGDALSWFSWMKIKMTFGSWTELEN